jgi:quercetin dioxygenase-like cupin family protein
MGAARRAVHVATAEALEGDGFEMVSGRRIRVVASPSLENANNMAIGLTIVADGGSSPRHEHDGVEEGVYVISGTGRFLVGDEAVDVGPGSALFMPSNVPHNVDNTGAGELRMLWWYTPAGPEQNILSGKQGA